MYNTIVPNIFHGQCEPTQFSTEETEVSFSSIHNKLAITNIQSQNEMIQHQAVPLPEKNKVGAH